VSDESHVPDGSGVVDLHKGYPPEPSAWTLALFSVRAS
jgi:hypothetical protein